MMEMATNLDLTPFSLYRNICRDVAGESILPSVLVVMRSEKPATSANFILSIEFLRLENPPYRHETRLQYTGHPGSAYGEKNTTDRISTTHSHTLIFKEPNLANRHFIILVAGKDVKVASIQSFFWAFRKKSPRIKPTSVDVITRRLDHMC